jgi:hypothetical protein
MIVDNLQCNSAVKDFFLPHFIAAFHFSNTHTRTKGNSYNNAVVKEKKDREDFYERRNYDSGQQF